jgi:hypothetical protein
VSPKNWRRHGNFSSSTKLRRATMLRPDGSTSASVVGKCTTSTSVLSATLWGKTGAEEHDHRCPSSPVKLLTCRGALCVGRGVATAGLGMEDDVVAVDFEMTGRD